MKSAALTFLADIRAGVEPRWLSFCGSSGTGKTFLSQLITDFVPVELHHHPRLLSGVKTWDWGHLLTKLRDGEYWRTNDLEELNFLMLDDIGSSRDTEFALEQLFRILNSRTRKWTLITSNYSLEEIGKLMDMRIASRLIRDRNVCIEVDTMDYALRKV